MTRATTEGLRRDRSRVRAAGDRTALIGGIRDSLASGTGFAAGKIGVSEQALLAWPFLRDRCHDRRQQIALLAQTRLHCTVQMGVFPGDEQFLAVYAGLLADAVAELDVLGLPGGRLEADILAHYDVAATTVPLLDLEPNRSIPDDSTACYLPELRGRRVLLISSIAEQLARRAQQDPFEAVWAKTGKPWFAPASVTALEFPFAYDITTQAQFATSIELLDWITAHIDPETFDVALIAATNMGIPLAARIKGMGRVGIALGGSLQVLFGVGGRRWFDDPEWRRDYITDAWVTSERVPVTRSGLLVDGGAYW